MVAATTGRRQIMDLGQLIRRVTPRVRRTLSEMDYAQRKAFRLRTGIDPNQPRRRDIARIAELEALFALPTRRRDERRRDG